MAAAINRREFRLRTYLRGGSLHDVYERVLSDCLFVNISLHGARVRLPVEMRMPPKLIVFDERLDIKFGAEVRWQVGSEFGIYIRDGIPSWMPRLCDQDGLTQLAWVSP